MLTFLRGSLPARRSPSLQREMKSDMTAEAFVERHGRALLQWLQANTVECACSTPFGPDESLQRGTIDLTTSIACRRCFIPLGLHDVRLPRGNPTPNPGPIPNAHRRAAQETPPCVERTWSYWRAHTLSTQSSRRPETAQLPARTR